MKKVIITILAFLLIAFIVISVLVFVRQSGSKNNVSVDLKDVQIEEIPEKLFEATEISEIVEIEKKYNIKTIDSDVILYHGIKCYGKNVDIGIDFNADGGINSTYAYSILLSNKDKTDGEGLKKEIKEYCSKFLTRFSLQLNDNYYILTDDGILDDSVESFEKILSGEATFRTSVKENNWSYWIFKVSKNPLEDVVFYAYHYLDASQSSTPANFDLSSH